MDKPATLAERLQPVIRAVPQQPQTQVSLDEQLAALTVIAEPAGRALPPESVSVPAFTEVNPVKVFTAPRVNSEAPVFTKS